MQYTSALAILAFVPAIAAQYGSGSGSGSSSSSSMDSSAPSSTSTAMATATSGSVTIVAVGNNGLTFNPSSIMADAGAQIQFQFYPKNHSVAQSTFGAPCAPKANGIFSGFQASTTGPNKQAFTITVNDTKPIWLYCSQGSHCQGGMSMVINQPSNATLQTYQSVAKGTTTVPSVTIAGGAFGDASASGSSGTTPGSSTTSAPATTSTAAAPGTVRFGLGGVGVVGGALAFAVGLM